MARARHPLLTTKTPRQRFRHVIYHSGEKEKRKGPPYAMLLAASTLQHRLPRTGLPNAVPVCRQPDVLVLVSGLLVREVELLKRLNITAEGKKRENDDILRNPRACTCAGSLKV